MPEKLKASHVNGKWTPELNRTQTKRIDAAAKLIDKVVEMTYDDMDRTLSSSIRAFLVRYAPDQVDSEGELLPSKPRSAEPLPEQGKAGEGEEPATGPEQKSDEELAA